MATYYGDNATLRDVNLPSQKIDVRENYGKKRHAFDQITLAAELAASDVIKVMKLPKGAQLVDAHVIVPASGTSGKFSVGWAASADGAEAADADGIIAEQDPGTAAVNVSMDKSAAAGYQKKFAAEVQIQFAITELTDAASGDTWKLELEYVVE